MTDILRVGNNTELCERLIQYAENCSWIVDKHLADLLH